jgi:hypothetical protein
MRFIKGLTCVSLALLAGSALAQTYNATTTSTVTHNYAMFVDETNIAFPSVGSGYQEVYKCICETSTQYGAGSNLEVSLIHAQSTNGARAANGDSRILSVRNNAGAEQLSGATAGFNALASAGGAIVPGGDWRAVGNSATDRAKQGYVPEMEAYVQSKGSAGANSGGNDAIAGTWDYLVWGDTASRHADCTGTANANGTGAQCLHDPARATNVGFLNVRMYNTSCVDHAHATQNDGITAHSQFSGGPQSNNTGAAVEMFWNCGHSTADQYEGPVANGSVIHNHSQNPPGGSNVGNLTAISSNAARAPSATYNPVHQVQHSGTGAGGNVFASCNATSTFDSYDVARRECGDHPFVGVHFATAPWAIQDTYRVHVRVTGAADTHG